MLTILNIKESSEYLINYLNNFLNQSIKNHQLLLVIDNNNMDLKNTIYEHFNGADNMLFVTVDKIEDLDISKYDYDYIAFPDVYMTLHDRCYEKCITKMVDNNLDCCQFYSGNMSKFNFYIIDGEENILFNFYEETEITTNLYDKVFKREIVENLNIYDIINNIKSIGLIGKNLYYF